jgi:hypothetical protein
VAHGCAVVQGLVSTPVDETKVRVRLPVACAGSAIASMVARAESAVTMRVMVVAFR